MCLEFSNDDELLLSSDLKGVIFIFFKFRKLNYGGFKPESVWEKLEICINKLFLLLFLDKISLRLLQLALK